MRRRRRPNVPALFIAALAVIIFAAGCSDLQLSPPETAQTKSPLFAPSLTPDVTVVTGEIGPGAKYALYVPDDWNGDLVLYAHGFIDPEMPIVLPTADEWGDLRDELVGLGYAVAYSSYSENGFAVKDGARRTHQISGVFAEHFGKPERTYLAGHSLGGLVAVLLAEKYPGRYDGALVMCGMIGGSQAQIDYIANVRVLWDLFYEDVLPGDVCNVPEDVDLWNEVVIPMTLAMEDDPTGAGAIARIDQAQVAFSALNEIGETLITAVAFNFRGFHDVLDRTHQHCPVDNADVTYTGALVPADVLGFINAFVGRFSTTPDAENYLDHHYKPSGDLRIPMLTLHNTWDPAVPVFHETMYEQAVASAGNSNLLVQQRVNLYGHCKFGTTADEGVSRMKQAFQELVNWVENDVKPSP